MAHSLKSVRHLLKDKPTLKHLESEISTQRALLGEIRGLLPGELAPHCIAARVNGHQLVLHSDTPVWASRLRYMAAELLSLLQNAHPALREIKIKLLPANQPRPRRYRPARRSPAGAIVVGDTAVHTEEPELRAALERLSTTLGRRG